MGYVVSSYCGMNGIMYRFADIMNISVSFHFLMQINLYWNNLTPGRKVVAGIIGANVAVFLMWKVPALTPLMLKYFSSSPMSGKGSSYDKWAGG